jgi:hypothetical protein
VRPDDRQNPRRGTRDLQLSRLPGLPSPSNDGCRSEQGHTIDASLTRVRAVGAGTAACRITGACQAYGCGLASYDIRASEADVMILGMSLSRFTTLHVILSLIGIASGLLVLMGMLVGRQLESLTALFLAARF